MKTWAEQTAERAAKRAKRIRKAHTRHLREWTIFHVSGRHGMVVLAWYGGKIEAEWDTLDGCLNDADINRIADLLLYAEKVEEPISDWRGWRRSDFQEYLNR